MFSALLPGSGQVYAGHPYDGMRHFLLNGLLGYLVYRTVDDGNYAGIYLLAGISLPFYMGNVMGAGKSSRQFNKSKRMDHLCRVLATAPLTTN